MNNLDYSNAVQEAMFELGITQGDAATEIARIYYSTETPSREEVESAKRYIQGVLSALRETPPKVNIILLVARLLAFTLWIISPKKIGIRFRWKS